MIQLRKLIQGPWEAVRKSLWDDLVTIEEALNKNWGSVFNGNNVINPGNLPVLTVDNGGTGFDTYDKGDLLVGNASHTLSKQAVGSNGQVLTADSTATDGVSWQTPVTSVPTVVTIDSTYTGAYNYLTEQSIEIAAGIKLEIGAGTHFVIEGNANANELWFSEVGSVNNSKIASALNPSNLTNVIDWFIVINATQPTPITGTAFHTKKNANWMGPTFRWPSGTTIATFVGVITTNTNAADDSNGAALSANTTYAHSTANADNLGWTFQVPVSPQRRVLYVQTGAFACDNTITFKFSNSIMPTRTYTIVDSNNAGVIDAPTGVIITFWGPPCIMTVSANTANKSTTAPTAPFAFALLSEG